jgi:CrcB protein
MATALCIAGFGALGCLARYYLSGWLHGYLGRGFPYGTLAVNIIGAFFIGLMAEYCLRSTLIPENLRLGLTIGLMGGLTTFSTFSYETLKLLEDGQLFTACVNVLASVVVCLMFTGLGIIVARHIS